jgi:hypothetical protein
MKPYSKDLRLRVLAAVDRGMPREEVAETFGLRRLQAHHKALPQAATRDGPRRPQTAFRSAGPKGPSA